MRNRKLCATVVGLTAAPALAQFYPPNDPNFYHNNALNARWPYQVSNAVDPNIRVSNTSVRQVNITGATLFRDFFELSSSTNDFIDADRDGCKGFNPPDPNCPIVDQLADLPGNSWWQVQYHGVGSLGGYKELLDFGLCGQLWVDNATERSNINRRVYYNPSDPNGCLVAAGGWGQGPISPGIDGLASVSCHPRRILSVDMATIDVVSFWCVQVEPAAAETWSAKPADGGYGLAGKPSKPVLAFGAPEPGPFSADLQPDFRTCGGLKQVNYNRGANDQTQNTLYDTAVAFVPVVPCVNRGVVGNGDPNFGNRPWFKYTELQHLYVTGRLPSGENLNAGGRDAESGTRNAWANSLGIDPSQCVGDNVGGRTSVSNRVELGAVHRVANCGSSSIAQAVPRWDRLAVSYSGLAGGTAACFDALQGRFEILGVIKNVAPYNATQVVRPTTDAVIHNADPNTGYTIGGTSVFTTFGDPFEYDPNRPEFMENQHAADFLRNTVSSINQFSAFDPNRPDPNLMPSEGLAKVYFLLNGQDAAQSDTDPVAFADRRPLSANDLAVQNFELTFNRLGVTSSYPGVTPPFGVINVAGQVPRRNNFDPNNLNSLNTYIPYTYYNGASFTSVSQGNKLSRRNQLTGDFNLDGVRDADDCNQMLVALQDPNSWMIAHTTASNGGDPNNFGNMAADCPIPAIIGDFNGDGAFDAKDVRFWADGLALDPNTSHNADARRLRRDLGFTRVDTQWLNLTTSDRNFFDTAIVSGNAPALWPLGASRFDVAGSCNQRPGAAPEGADGKICAADYYYVQQNFGTWSNLNQAQDIDLSCDMNGDLVIDQLDLQAMIAAAGWAGAPCQGDLDCSGAVDQDDLDVVLFGFGSTGVCRTAGDADGDGDVDQDDLDIVLFEFGCTY